MNETVAPKRDFPSTLKGKPAQIDAYLAIKESDEAIRPSEISQMTGRSIDSTNRAVGKLLESGLVEKPGHGLYTLASASHNGNSDLMGGAEDSAHPSHPEDDDLSSLLRSQTTMEIHTKAEAAAGNGRITYPDAHTYTVDVPRAFLSELLGFHPPSEIGIMRSDGDSMRPTIRDEEMIIYRPLRDGIRGAGVYVVWMTHGAVVKRVQPLSDGGYRIISDNSFQDYKNETLVPTESGDELVKKSSGNVVTFNPVGKVLFPNRSTDEMHVKQVSEIIRRVVGREVDLQEFN